MRMIYDDQVRDLLRRALPTVLLGIQKSMQREGLPSQDIYAEFVFDDDHPWHDFRITCHDVVLYAKTVGNAERRTIIVREDTGATGGVVFKGQCDCFLTLNGYPKRRWERMGRCIGNQSMIPATKLWSSL